jgi:hypothetical protein
MSRADVMRTNASHKFWFPRSAAMATCAPILEKHPLGCQHARRECQAARTPARHALRDHAQACLCGGKVRESWLAPQARGSACEDDRTAAERNQPPRRLAADEEAAKAADPPELLELLRAQFLEIDAPVVARVEDHNTRRVDRDRFGAAARRTDRFEDLCNLLGRSPGDQHMIPFHGEAAAQRGTKPALSAHTHDDCGSAAIVRAHPDLPVVAGRFDLMMPSVHGFDRKGDALAAANAERDDAALKPDASHRVNELCTQDSAGCADRMAVWMKIV